MQIEHVKRAWRVPDLSPAERLVLVELTDAAHSETRLAFPSRKRICRNTGLHAKTVQLALRELVSKTYIGEVRAAARGRTRTFTVRPENWPDPSTKE